MVSWMIGIDLLTYEQKIAYLRNRNVGTGNQKLTLSTLNWWWINIGSELQNGQMDGKWLDYHGRVQGMDW